MRSLDCNLQKNNKSLIKSEARFTKSHSIYHGGTHGAQGRFFKASDTAGKVSKPYYLAERKAYQEYFAFEILNAIGFSTPKARFIETSNKSSDILPHQSSVAALVGEYVTFEVSLERKIYNTLVMMIYLLNIVCPDNHYKNRLFTLLKTHDIDLTHMGFPNDWEKRAIWQ
jgi:hypothetical protein